MSGPFRANLQKPHPMALHYHTNGGGRDSYIYADNGGFSYRDFNTAGLGYTDSGTMKPQKAYASPAGTVKLLPKMGKPIHYVHNGQGRDSYISSTNGGFMSPGVTNPAKGTFFNQLRSYERTNNNSLAKSPSKRSISPDETGSTRLIDEYLDSKADHFQMG